MQQPLDEADELLTLERAVEPNLRFRAWHRIHQTRHARWFDPVSLALALASLLALLGWTLRTLYSAGHFMPPH